MLFTHPTKADQTQTITIPRKNIKQKTKNKKKGNQKTKIEEERGRERNLSPVAEFEDCLLISLMRSVTRLPLAN